MTRVMAPRDASNRTFVPATDKQEGFLNKLLVQKQVPAEAQGSVDRLSARLLVGQVSKGEAGQVIDWLLKLPNKPRAAGAPRPTDLPDVPAGRYAVEVPGGEETDGEPVLRFFKVDRPEAPSRWAGYTFVKQMASDEEWPVRGQRAKDVLAKIAEDPAAASARYGHEIGACGICGRTLTDAESRARGIGPICADKAGW